MLLCETLPDLSCMVVDLPCSSIVKSLTCWYAFLLILSEAYFHFLAFTLYPIHFCHLHLCPDLSFNLSTVTGSFWLASLFLQISSLVTMIKDLKGNTGLPLPTLLEIVSFCPFSLPPSVVGWLRFVIVAFPGLFYKLFCHKFSQLPPCLSG